MTVGELLRRIDSRELTAWAAYERVAGPLGPERLDILAAIIAATIANANRTKKGKAFKPADFMPDWEKASRSAQPQTEHDHLRIIRGLNRAFGGQERG